MRSFSTIRTLIILCVLTIALCQAVAAQEGEDIKWYGIGGEFTEPHHWLGRVGVTESLGAEIVFGMEHVSQDCPNGTGDCDRTDLDVGIGFIYDLVPTGRITPYMGGRFILSMIGDGDSETSGTVEAAGGVEYVIMKRIGVSGELNFSFATDPTHILTTTRVRCYFYL
jgi:hypothetical protein